VNSDIDIDTTAQILFREYVLEVLGELRIDAGAWTEFYLVDLLARKAPSISIDEPLVTQMAACAATNEPSEKFEGFRSIGDTALLLSGFFRDRVKARGVDLSYVVSVGSRAYEATASLSGSYDGLTEAYSALSDRFLLFSRVLAEVREMTSMKKRRGILGIYNKWKQIEPPRKPGGLHLRGPLFVPEKDED